MSTETDALTVVFVDYSTNWALKIKKNFRLKSGKSINVEQSEWKNMHIEVDADTTKLLLSPSNNPFPFTKMGEERVVENPSLVIVRNFSGGLHGESFRNIVIGLNVGAVPMLNSAKSVLTLSDRALSYAELLKIRRNVGVEKFPLINMQFYSNLQCGTGKQLIAPKEFPIVVKVSSTHAGFGKSLCKDQASLDDLKSILALTTEYFSIEPFVGDVEYEFRLQQIGTHRRAFRRNSDTSWKNNWGNLSFVDHPWEDKYDEWMDSCARICDGLDMFALDVLHKEDGTDVILELNDGAFGLMYEHEEEDTNHIRDLVVELLEKNE